MAAYFVVLHLHRKTVFGQENRCDLFPGTCIADYIIFNNNFFCFAINRQPVALLPGAIVLDDIASKYTPVWCVKRCLTAQVDTV